MVREIKQPGKYRRETKVSLSAKVSPVNNFRGRQCMRLPVFALCFHEQVHQMMSLVITSECDPASTLEYFSGFCC